MLVQFQVSNHLSFKDSTIFSMVGVPSFKEHCDTHLIRVDENLSLLKSAGIFGANASGKSNFIRSVSKMKSFVLNSFRDALKEEGDNSINIQPFQLSTVTENAPSSFEVIFELNAIFYRYGFSVDKEKVIAEHLYYTRERETPLFVRDFQTIEVNKTSFGEGIGLEDKTRENVLFLSVVAQLNGKVANAIVGWFNNFNTISGLQDQTYRTYTINKLKNDPEFQKWVSDFVNFLEIEKVTAEEIEVSISMPEGDDEELQALFKAMSRKSAEKKLSHLVTWHRKYDENGLLVDTVPFIMRSQESEGTKKFIYLLGPWYDTLMGGKVLVIDELDSRLHTLLTRRLIDFFNKQEGSKAQVVFALHDTNLLDRELFRRDQIWFVEKDQYGASDLYSLSDYKSVRVKATDNFEKHYIAGKYGAIPYFGDLQKLTTLIDAEEEIIA